jgi:hypothetical protein
MSDIVLATYAGVWRILFSILQIDSLSPTVSVPLLPSDPFLIGLLVARGFIVANGEDGASKTGWKSWELLPIWINEGAGIVGPMRFSRPNTFF